MRRALFAASLGGSMLLSACATVLPRSQAGTELAGQSLRVQTSRGDVSTLQFREDGAVRALFGERQLVGRWQVVNQQLCFFWGQAPRECWPYRGAFRRGQTVSVTSDRGNVVRVTRL